VLARAHIRLPRINPWPQVAARFVPWALAWALYGAGVVVGTLALFVPGMILGVRLFWADEFALTHRQGPIAAARQSLELTRGLVGTIYFFQFGLGLVQQLVLVPVVLVFTLALDAIVGAYPSSLPISALLAIASAVVAVNLYASVHAPEIVYFYGLRALRAEMPSEKLSGNWVARGLRGPYGSASSLPACPRCGAAWNPADYSLAARTIRCSWCQTPLERPAAAAPAVAID